MTAPAPGLAAAALILLLAAPVLLVAAIAVGAARPLDQDRGSLRP